MEIYKITSKGLEKCLFEEVVRESENKYWIIATPQEMVEINDFFSFSPHTIEECLSQKQVPRIEVYDNMSFGVLNLINKQDDFVYAEEINFYLTKNHLIFVPKLESEFIQSIKTDANTSINWQISGMYGLNKILYILIDRLTSSHNEILSRLEEEISDIEELLISEKKRDYIKDIIDLRRQLLFLKRYYEPLLDIVENLEENENQLIDPKTMPYFKILTNRIERLNRNVLNLRDYVTQVREAYQAQVDINLNNIMKFFTVITTIFLPLGLIAGWYGMNFANMPELHWVYGYPFAFLLSGIVVFICIIYFKKNRFL